MKKLIRKFAYNILRKLIPEIEIIKDKQIPWESIKIIDYGNNISSSVKLYQPYKITNSIIGSYSYIAPNAIINHTSIGKFCSIGPNVVSGWGIHPKNGISTSPMFYSTKKQNGISLSTQDKIEEIKAIVIGNDVFIGMNVSILDGVTIGDGAIIGAGAVVSTNIPPYAIAVGCPIEIKGFRFNLEVRQRLLESKWWDLPYEKLNIVEQQFWNIDSFLNIIEAFKKDNIN